MFKRVIVCLFLIPQIIFLSVSESSSDIVKLHIPIIEDSPGLHLYFHELIETALKKSGHTPILIKTRLPQVRVKNYMDKGLVTIFWMIKSEERDKKYIPVNVGLTSGMIGKRILFIKKSDQHIFDEVNNLVDFRSLNAVGWMGDKWFDVEVWKENRLKYHEYSGSWKKIFSMIPYGREYNYFSRGINEILTEAKQYPDISIEKRLVLIYDRDFCFYLSKNGVNSGEKYEGIIREAMIQAKDSGLIEHLVRKYWAEDFKTLNYDSRKKIYLKTPE